MLAGLNISIVVVQFHQLAIPHLNQSSSSAVKFVTLLVTSGITHPLLQEDSISMPRVPHPVASSLRHFNLLSNSS
jgi:hypothetical protein